MDNWQAEALKRRSDLVKALTEAHLDAGYTGAGWIKIDIHGNATRVDPKQIVITVVKGGKTNG